MKTLDIRRHRTLGPVLRTPMPPSIARVPLVDLCQCKHARESHEHYTHADDCAQCDCRLFRRWEPAGV